MVSLAHLFAQKTGTSHRNGSWDQKCFLEGLSNDIAGVMGNNVNLDFWKVLVYIKKRNATSSSL